MTRKPLLRRLAHSGAKRADAFLTKLGFPDCVSVAATHAREYKRWVKKDGDSTHRLDYQLSEDDIVFDVGGYRGDWAAEIYDRFGSQIHVFEPVASYCKQIEERFAGNDHVHVHRFGLSASDETMSLAILEDSTSQFKPAAQSEQCELRSISDFTDEHGIKRIALLKLNIEGGEYDLLEHLIETGLIELIDNIQVQFHWFVPNARKRMSAIQKGLQATHDATYQYTFVWENWASRAA